MASRRGCNIALSCQYSVCNFFETPCVLELTFGSCSIIFWKLEYIVLGGKLVNIQNLFHSSVNCGWDGCFQPRQRISHSTSLLLPHFCRIVAWAILVVDTNSYNFTMQSEVHLSCQGRSLPLSSSPPYVSPHCLPHSAGSLPGEGKCSSQGILTSGPGCTVPIRYKR